MSIPLSKATIEADYCCKTLDDIPPSTVQEQFSAVVLTAVHDQLLQLQPNDNTSLHEILEKAGVTENVYIQALKWIKTRSGQPAVLLKRKPGEINVNKYNKTLMKSWEANLDVQFVTNTYACVMYVASYVSKPEKKL